jgi:hypothetical protein
MESKRIVEQISLDDTDQCADAFDGIRPNLFSWCLRITLEAFSRTLDVKE